MYDNIYDYFSRNCSTLLNMIKTNDEKYNLKYREWMNCIKSSVYAIFRM